MPDKHPNTHRWGGPGSSHEDRSKPEPPPVETRAPGEPTNTPYSHVSGGGGERDRRHGHDPLEKRNFQENSAERRKP
ncbi:hypothetical protein LJR219_000970 [Phenylobacterium sp. LjRoot219]|uniref:hypothetical protein n=1 Tax=Phenylobacterium sp. LjRoot219 TaxID=3342283 RepID=UPI003ECECEE4